MLASEPDAFSDTFVAMAGARAIIAATRLGVFDALAEEPAPPDGLARRLGLELVGVEALLTALAAMGYLAVDSRGAYSPANAGMRLLAGTSETLAHFVGGYNAHAWAMLGALEETLRGARAPASHHRPAADPFWEAYIRGLFELTRHEHAGNAQLVPVTEPGRLLDVAGGHGGFAMAMCRRFPRLRASVLDLPASARVGRQLVAREGLEDRVSFREGDALSDPLGEELDVLSAFNLLHHLRPGDVKALLARAHGALRTGGYLVIGDTERPEAGQPACLNGALSAIVYFVSSGTRNYTRRELADWLEQAGFAAVQMHRSSCSPWRLLVLAQA